MYGLMPAPIIHVPTCNQDQCDEIAQNMLDFYMQFKDVPQIKVVGVAPLLLCKVTYKPFNGTIPPQICGGSEVYTNAITGIVTKRVIELSADGGFISTLDIATSSAALEAAGIDISNELNTLNGITNPDGKRYSQHHYVPDDPENGKWLVNYWGRENLDGTVEYQENSIGAEGFPQSTDWTTNSDIVPPGILNDITRELAG